MLFSRASAVLVSIVITTDQSSHASAENNRNLGRHHRRDAARKLNHGKRAERMKQAARLGNDDVSNTNDEDPAESSKGGKSKGGKSKGGKSKRGKSKGGKAIMTHSPTFEPTPHDVDHPTNYPTYDFEKPDPSDCKKEYSTYYFIGDEAEGMCTNLPDIGGKEYKEGKDACCEAHYPDRDCVFIDICDRLNLYDLCPQDPSKDGIFPVCPGNELGEICDGEEGCESNSCDCFAGYTLCDEGLNVCDEFPDAVCAKDLGSTFPVCPGFEAYCDGGADCGWNGGPCECDIGRLICEEDVNICASEDPEENVYDLCAQDPDKDGIFPVCPGNDPGSYCDGTNDCITPLCDCVAGYELCNQKVNVCDDYPDTVCAIYEEDAFPVCPGFGNVYCDGTWDCNGPLCDCEVGSKICDDKVNLCNSTSI
mmetsp:Transcript_8941/g.21717  ORF Transcript_8941/g.21717 Transcript_8941/m.21717 type:complete len:421 (+) Transcript_8941:123-1385(+)